MLKLLDISEICYMIQRFNSYNFLSDKVTEKVLDQQFTDYMKKAKKSTGELEMNFP